MTTYRIAKTKRENLPDMLAGLHAGAFLETPLAEVCTLTLNRDEIIVGYFGLDIFDPNPDFLICLPEVYDDLLAWLAAYLPGHSPISQWCRIWRSTDFGSLTHAKGKPFIASSLAAWTGAILAEVSMERGGQSLVEVTGLAAMHTATFCAARATAIWNVFDQYGPLAQRIVKVGEGERQLWKVSEDVAALWYVLAGDVWNNNLPSRSNVFEELRTLFRATNGRETIDPDSIQDAARHFADIFGVPVLAACGAGPQSQRVDALDKVASSVSSLPKSPMSGAILGLAASLIDPGSAVMPSLLKQYDRQYPLAQMWAGAFAGVWSPARVLNDHKGLGRIISKELLAPSDLFSKPLADIGFDEFQRWRGDSPSSAVGVRGSSLQMTTVELLPGVSIPIAHSRAETARESRSSIPVGRQQSFDLDSEARRATRSNQSIEAKFEDVVLRLHNLERQVESLSSKAARPSTNAKKRP